jgi:hypothetical protein
LTIKKHPTPNRVTRSLTPQQLALLHRHRRQIARELPDITKQNQMRKKAGDEPTLSGKIRRAIHNSHLSLAEIAATAGLSLPALDESLTGEHTLRSDVLDRLAASLGFELSQP